MSFARCNPDFVEKAAEAFRDALGTVHSLMSRVEEAVCLLVARSHERVDELASAVEALRGPEGDHFHRARVQSQLDAARQRLAAVQRATARLEELVKLGCGIDSKCDELAEHLDQVAKFARDVSRGGIPEPYPRRSSATSAEIQSNLNDVLNSAHISQSDLPPLPPEGAGAPRDPRDEVKPTDTSNWWER